MSENELCVRMPFHVVVFHFYEMLPIALDGQCFLFRLKLVLPLSAPSDFHFFENEVDKSGLFFCQDLRLMYFLLGCTHSTFG